MKDIVEVSSYLSLLKDREIIARVGIDRSKLSLEEQSIRLCDCTKCEKRYLVRENGLFEDNVALFWIYANKGTSSEYCAGKNENHDKRVSQPFCFCFNTVITRFIPGM